MRQVLLWGVAVGAVAAAGACGSESTDGLSATSSAPTSTTISIPVDFVPCTDLADSVVVAAGFDPATRSSGDADDYFHTGRACSFRSETRELLLVSSTNPFDGIKERERESIQSSDPINGRVAFVAYRPTDRYTCTAVLQTGAGFLAIATTVRPDYRGLVEPCDGIVELATLIEPEIGEGN